MTKRLTPQEIMRRIYARLQPFRKPDGSLYIVMENRVKELLRLLRTFHAGRYYYNEPVVEKVMSVDGGDIKGIHYQVIKAISKAVGTRVYCKLILEDNNLEPTRALVIIGYSMEVSLTLKLFTHLMEVEMLLSYTLIKAAKSIKVSIDMGYRKYLREKFFNPLIELFSDYSFNRRNKIFESGYKKLMNHLIDQKYGTNMDNTLRVMRVPRYKEGWYIS